MTGSAMIIDITIVIISISLLIITLLTIWIANLRTEIMELKWKLTSQKELYEEKNNNLKKTLLEQRIKDNFMNINGEPLTDEQIQEVINYYY